MSKVESRFSNLLAELREIEFELRKRCHSDICKIPYDCPKHHKETGCNEKLNLETSILWESAMALREVDYLMKIPPESGFSDMWKMDRIRSLGQRIFCFHAIFMRHDEQYASSCALLHKARVQVVTINTFLERKDEKK